MGFRLRFGEFRIARRVVLDAVGVAVVGFIVVVGSVGLGVVVVVLVRIVVFAVVTTLALGRSR